MLPKYELRLRMLYGIKAEFHEEQNTLSRFSFSLELRTLHCKTSHHGLSKIVNQYLILI